MHIMFFCRHVAALIFAAAVGLLASAPASANPSVTVDNGTLVGLTSDGVHVFKGVPYATPPTGVRRWRPPEPHEDWHGRRFAMSFAPECPQLPYPEGSFFERGISPSSEDCLYLNVWTTSLDEKARRPVMV